MYAAGYVVAVGVLVIGALVYKQHADDKAALAAEAAKEEAKRELFERLAPPSLALTYGGCYGDNSRDTVEATGTVRNQSAHQLADAVAVAEYQGQTKRAKLPSMMPGESATFRIVFNRTGDGGTCDFIFEAAGRRFAALDVR